MISSAMSHLLQWRNHEIFGIFVFDIIIFYQLSVPDNYFFLWHFYANYFVLPYSIDVISTLFIEQRPGLWANKETPEAPFTNMV